MKTTVFAILAVLLSTASAQMEWTCATPSAPWAPRSMNTLVAFHDTMWLTGGLRLYPDSVEYNDVWKSADGANWRRAIEHAVWSPRDGAASVVFHDTMWLMGGEDLLQQTLADVWCSADGSNWTCVESVAPWGDRLLPQVVVFRDTMWLAGGLRWHGAGYTALSDVWRTGDGRNWTCVDTAARWGVRAGHTLLAFRDTMWLMGGSDWTSSIFSDVWKSGDGDSWILVTDTARWGPKYMHGSVVLGDSMWVIGSRGFFPGLGNDVWCSADGDTWLQANAAAGWRPRRHVTALAYHDRIWVMAGDTSPGLYTGSNDVWYSEAIPGVEEAPNAELRTPKCGPTIVRDVLSLQADSRQNVGYRADLLDISGRKVLDLRPGANDVRGLAPGVYFLRRASGEGRMANAKVVVTE